MIVAELCAVMTMQRYHRVSRIPHEPYASLLQYTTICYRNIAASDQVPASDVRYLIAQGLSLTAGTFTSYNFLTLKKNLETKIFGKYLIFMMSSHSRCHKIPAWCVEAARLIGSVVIPHHRTVWQTEVVSISENSIQFQFFNSVFSFTLAIRFNKNIKSLTACSVQLNEVLHAPSF